MQSRHLDFALWAIVWWAVGLGVTLGCTADQGAQQRIRPGIEVLLSDSIHLVQNKRVGLITNHTGIDRNGVGDVERLLAAELDLTAVFAPEHGFRGTLEREIIGHGRDSAAGLPVFSLYGDVRAPTPDMLDLVDVLLIDLQDIGARTYTYISTTLLAMEVAAEVGVSVLVLDRPNPIGGVHVQGPHMDSGYTSYVGMMPVPLRHGMTLGELALLGNDAYGYGADLTVVPASGWRREVWFDGTGLPWIRPSPNMPDIESATHYPGLVLFEGTNLSVGRGTPVAFRVIAAPWLDPAAVIEQVAGEAGVTLKDTVVKPREPGDRKYADEILPAIVLEVNDRSAYDPARLAARLLGALESVHPDSFEIRNAGYFDHRVGNEGLRSWLEGGRDGEIWQTWEADLEDFRRVREKYLVYP